MPYLHKMKPIDLNLLTALDALLTTGSVSAAAERMHLSAPAMSHALARLREALGDPLLVRAGRRLMPTPRAVALREPVRRLVAEASELMQPGTEARVAQTPREFVIRAPEGAGIVYGATMLAMVQQRVPLASLRFVAESDSDAMALREGRVDLEIGAAHDRGPEVLSSPLYEQQWVGVARKGHALLAGRVTLKRFAAEAHVAVARRERALTPLDRLLGEAGVARRVLLTVPSTYGAMMAAGISDLVASVPDRIAHTVAAALGLVVFKLPVVVPPEQVVQAWHPRLDADPAHRWLRECVETLPARVRHGPLRQRAHRAMLGIDER